MLPRALFVTLALALQILTPAVAAADHDPVVNLTAHRTVETQTIFSGPRWFFSSTPQGRIISRRGSAGSVVLGRDWYTADGGSAFALEAQLGSTIGGLSRAEHAGIGLGLKLRSSSHRLELALAVAAIDHFDPRHVTDIDMRGGVIWQLAFDLDDSRPYSTRIVARTELHQPSDTRVTLDTFVGIGTRWQ